MYGLTNQNAGDKYAAAALLGMMKGASVEDRIHAMLAEEKSEVFVVAFVLAHEDYDEPVRVEYCGPDYGLAVIVARSIFDREQARDKDGKRKDPMPTVRMYKWRVEKMFGQERRYLVSVNSIVVYEHKALCAMCDTVENLRLAHFTADYKEWREKEYGPVAGLVREE